MPNSVSVVVPGEFAGQVASASPERLEALQRSVREDLDQGNEAAAVIARLAVEGWDRDFAAWFVNAAAATTDEVRLEVRFTAYPRGAEPGGELKGTAEDLLNVNQAFNMLNWSLLLWLLGILLFIFLLQFNPGGAFVFGLAALCQLAGSASAVLAAFKAASALKWSRAFVVIYALLLTAIPCASFLFLVSVSARFTDYLQKAGVKVGLMGPNREALARAVALRGGTMPDWRG